MNTRTFTLTTAPAYTVDVVDARTAARQTRGHGPAARFATWAFMILTLLTLGVVNIPSANAALLEDGARASMCSMVYHNADSVEPNLLPLTTRDTLGDDGKVRGGLSQTAYEKYGTSGVTRFTVWAGPDDEKALEDLESATGEQLIRLAGGTDDKSLLGNVKGDGGIDKWDGESVDHPAFFNHDRSCGDWLNAIPSEGAGAIMQVNGVIVWLAGTMYQVSTEASTSVIDGLEPTIVEIVTTLKDSFYLEFFTIGVMLAALWLGYMGLVKRSSTAAATGFGWMMGAAITGMVMLANPMAPINLVNTVVEEVTSGVVVALNNPIKDAVADEDSLCYADEASNNADPDVDPETRETVRVMQCAMWKTFLYEPWEMAQFGQKTGEPGSVNYINDQGSEPGAYGVLDRATPILTDGDRDEARLPENISFGDRDIPASWSLLQLDSSVHLPGDSKVNEGRHMLHIASAQTYRPDPNQIWAGNSAENRLGIAMVTFVGVVVSLGLMILLCLEILMLQVLLVVLVLLAPIFMLVGLHPGYGRRVALVWLNTIVEVGVKRIVIGLELAALMLMFSVIMTVSMDWVIKMAVMFATAWAFVVAQQRIQKTFTAPINFGNLGKIHVGDGAADTVKRAALRLGKTGANAATGAVTAGATGVGLALVDSVRDARDARSARKADAAKQVDREMRKEDRAAHRDTTDRNATRDMRAKKRQDKQIEESTPDSRAKAATAALAAEVAAERAAAAGAPPADASTAQKWDEMVAAQKAREAERKRRIKEKFKANEAARKAERKASDAKRKADRKTFGKGASELWRPNEVGSMDEYRRMALAEKPELAEQRPTPHEAVQLLRIAQSFHRRGGGVSGLLAASQTARQQAKMKELAAAKVQQRIDKEARFLRRNAEKTAGYEERIRLIEQFKAGKDPEIDLRPAPEPDWDALALERTGLTRDSFGAGSVVTTGGLRGAKARTSMTAARRSAGAVKYRHEQVRRHNAFVDREVEKEIKHLQKEYREWEKLKADRLKHKEEYNSNARPRSSAPKGPKTPKSEERAQQ